MGIAAWGLPLIAPSFPKLYCARVGFVLVDSLASKTSISLFDFNCLLLVVIDFDKMLPFICHSDLCNL